MKKGSSFRYGVILIVLTQKVGGEGSSQMHTMAYKGEGAFKIAYVRRNAFFWTRKSQHFSFFCTKEAFTLLFFIVYRKV